MGDLGHISGRGHLAIPAHPVPSHLPLTSAPSDMPPYFSPVASGVSLGQGHPLGPTPGPTLPAGRSATAHPPSPLIGRLSVQTS